jgi:hypothetical protein
MEVDLHNFHPSEISVLDLVRQAWETGADELVLIHGHGHKRKIQVRFVNSNTGYFGLEIRRVLRHRTGELKEWAVVSSLNCSKPGETSIRLRSNPSPKRYEIDLPEPTMFEKWAMES